MFHFSQMDGVTVRPPCSSCCIETTINTKLGVFPLRRIKQGELPWAQRKGGQARARVPLPRGAGGPWVWG